MFDIQALQHRELAEALDQRRELVVAGARNLQGPELVEAHGLERMREPYVKHLEGPVWEMRMRGKDGIARAAYVTATGRRVVVVHVFPKKTQKTPRRESETALRRAKEVT